MNRHIGALEGKIEEGKSKLAELAAIGEDAWESVRENMESSWGTLKSAFGDAISKLKG